MLSEKVDGKIAKHKTSKSRVKLFRERQLSIGRAKREMYLTDSEHKALKLRLNEIRKPA